jgi:hypothetical protein
VATTGAGSSGGASGGQASDAPSLFRLLQSGLATVHSLHITLTSTVGTTTVRASGDEQVSRGRPTAFDLTDSVAGQSLRLITSGGRTYLHLPPALASGATKPYVLVSARSSNPTVRALATSLGSTLDSSSLASYNLLAQAASSVRAVGRTSVGGVAATHYALVVDFRRLPANYPNRAALRASGLKTVPVELHFDGQGRPVEVTERFTISGHTASVDLLVTRYNEPVHITAPPASQVDTH